MTKSAIAYSHHAESRNAGNHIGEQINVALQGEAPDVLIVFASARYDYPELLHAIDNTCNPKLMVGCSSAGEFTSNRQGDGAVSALALSAPDMRFTAAVGRGLRLNRAQAAQELVSSFKGINSHDYIYHTAIVFTDALAGQVDDFIEQLVVKTAGTYQFFGGGAGDDGLFKHTQVFYGTEAVSDAAVALEILSNKPVGIGVSHGWQPTTSNMRVTESDGMCVLSVNAMPSVEVFQEHAEQTNQQFDSGDPLPFFLHNIIGVATEEGHKLRVPLGVGAEGSVLVAADVPAGSTIQIMGVEQSSAAEAASRATRAALNQLQGYTSHVALFFDCVATRLRLGKQFAGELEAVQSDLGNTPFVGFNSYGQIARAEGQFNGFHNCTAVVLVFPE